MGREATVNCHWGEEFGVCKVLLESTELLVRGAFRRKVPISSLQNVSVEGEELRFQIGSTSVSLPLGSPVAQRWAKAIAAPPPRLASKLGITPESRLFMIGDLVSPELNAAIDEAVSATGKDADLVLIAADNAHDLEMALARIAERKTVFPPLWIVYPKGTAHLFGERSVRETMRGRGFIDTKVVSVSARLTALRFIARTAE